MSSATTMEFDVPENLAIVPVATDATRIESFETVKPPAKQLVQNQLPAETAKFDEQLTTAQLADPEAEESSAPDTKDNMTEQARYARRWYDAKKAKLQERIAELLCAEVGFQAELKNVKKEKKDLVDELTKLILRGPELFPLPANHDPLPEMDALPAADDKTTEPSPTTPATTDSAQFVVQVSWEMVPLAELGLSDFIHGKFVDDGIHTIGDFENRRAKVADGTGKWPKGVGKTKAAAAIETLLTWHTNHRDAAAFGEAAAVAAERKATTDAQSMSTVQSEWDNLTDAQRAIAIDRRAKEINTGEENCLVEKHPIGEGYWRSGYDAGSHGNELTDCPYIPGPEQDDWIRGFLSWQIVDEFDPDEGRNEENSQTATTNELVVASIDDL